jgi:hypothetical protein
MPDLCGPCEVLESFQAANSSSVRDVVGPVTCLMAGSTKRAVNTLKIICRKRPGRCTRNALLTYKFNAECISLLGLHSFIVVQSWSSLRSDLSYLGALARRRAISIRRFSWLM